MKRISTTRFETTVQFEPADLHAFATNAPWDLVPAPGVGKIILPEEVRFRYKYGALPIAGASGESLVSFVTDEAKPWAIRRADQSVDYAVAMDFIDSKNFNVAFDDTFCVRRIGDTEGPGAQDASQLLAALEDRPFTMVPTIDLDNGIVRTVTIADGGSGYALNDTLGWVPWTTDIYNNPIVGPHFRVTGVSGGGVVTAVAITPNQGSTDGVGSPHFPPGCAPQPGSGDGLELTIASVTPGDGNLFVTTRFREVTL